MRTDQILKEFWEDNERFADIFNTVFFEGKKVIRANELKTVSPDLSSAVEVKWSLENITKYRDKVKLWNGTALVIFGIENQAKVHYAMPERVMLLDALQYEHQRKRIAASHRKKRDLKEEKEYLSEYAKKDRLYPVLTAVIYYGEEPWDGPWSLQEMVNLPKELEKVFNDYRMHLFQILGNDGEDFENEDIRTVLRNANALRSGRVLDMDKKMNVELVKYLAAFVNSEKILNLSNREGRDVALCTALEEMIRAGEMRGKTEGKAEDILELLEELGFVSEELQKRIMGEKNLEVLKKWHIQAARVGSVKRFQEMM